MDRRTVGYFADLSRQNYLCCWIGSERVVRQMQLVHRWEMCFKDTHTVCTFQTYYSTWSNDTVTDIVEAADETVNRTMAIAMFRHQRSPVFPLRNCHNASVLCLGLYELQQEAAYLPFIWATAASSISTVSVSKDCVFVLYRPHTVKTVWTEH
jgi:hypothetical protein